MVTVTSAGAELVDTTTTTLSKSFSERQVVELAQTNVGGAFGGGVNNLALLAPNVSSSGGVGVGTGGSVGGQRPRNNNFMIDGVDNNSKSVTGPLAYVSPETVSEFSLVQNQFSAEFARSTGGQFITVTKTGSNDFHGSAYGFFRNRYLNALDARQIEEGFVREQNIPGTQFMPRFDYFRGGGNVGGPVILPRFGEGGPSIWNGKNKLFFFTSLERLQQRFGAPPAGITALTAPALATVAATAGISATNFGIYRDFVPVAAVNNAGTINFCRVRPDQNGLCSTGNLVQLGVGTIQLPPPPQFNVQNNFVLNIDYVQSAKTQHRARLNWTNNQGIGLAGLPIFNEPAPFLSRLFSYTLLHAFSSNLTNETRLAYRRSDQSAPVTTSFRFPGLDTTFPNIDLADLGVNIGPNGSYPQTAIENNYQVVNNVSYISGNHSLKFGGDFRQVISPQTFTQRARGDYNYSEAQFYFYDLTPDVLAQRSVGDIVYYGTQRILYGFVQDDWRVRPNLTLNLGLNYSYQEVPAGAQMQEQNALSSVPGLLEFHAPVSQKKNFGPRVGFAYSGLSSGLAWKTVRQQWPIIDSRRVLDVLRLYFRQPVHSDTAAASAAVGRSNWSAIRAQLPRKRWHPQRACIFQWRSRSGAREHDGVHPGPASTVCVELDRQHTAATWPGLVGGSALSRHTRYPLDHAEPSQCSSSSWWRIERPADLLCTACSSATRRFNVDTRGHSGSSQNLAAVCRCGFHYSDSFVLVEWQLHVSRSFRAINSSFLRRVPIHVVLYVESFDRRQYCRSELHCA